LRENIFNIPPALLQNFGVKVIYGLNVHRAVKEAGEKESGISIHLVNKKYDEGKILAQHICEISEDDTPEKIAEKIHELEHRYFAMTIEHLLSK
jgi:phosphoribosylglycinamide formyltransferase-1